MWLIYSFLLFISGILYLPFLLYLYFFNGKYRGCLLSRLGFYKTSFREGDPTIWIHAVSVGEIKAAATLVKELKKKYPLSSIIISSITQTGHEAAKASAPDADYHVFLPLDLMFIIRRFIGKLKVDLLLVVETDIWPNFIKLCKQRGARILLINGKISERSFKRLLAAPAVSKWYLSQFDLLLVQDEVYRSRFVDLRVKPECIKIIPNIKLDDVYSEANESEIELMRARFALQDLSIVVGSTHPLEEKLVLDQLIPLFEHYKRLKIFIVPRHPERFDEVNKLIQSYKVRSARVSQQADFHNAKIILVDQMGVLRQYYQLATVAIVAGSFVPKIGGHNVLEPLWYTTPCLFGPFMFNQDYFVKLVLNAKAGRQIEDDQIYATIHELFNDDFKLKQMGRRGKEIFIKSAGGTRQSLQFIEKLLEKKKLKK